MPPSGKVETDHGRSNLPSVHSGENFAGAGGPMQFLQSTFNGVISRHTIPPGGASPPSRHNPHDAIHAAAFYLCDSGAPGDLYKAIFAYNHADWYVKKVLEQAETYSNAAATTAGAGDCNAIRAPNPAAMAAINVRHVGLYIGAGKMIHAPAFGEHVQISNYRRNGDGYLGATRPAYWDSLR